MKNIRNPTFRIRKIIVITLFFILFFYFLYNILSGDRGIIALFKLSERHKALQEEVVILEEEKKILQGKVNRMKPESLDLDLLEARKNLGYAKKNETIYIEEN